MKQRTLAMMAILAISGGCGRREGGSRKAPSPDRPRIENGAAVPPAGILLKSSSGLAIPSQEFLDLFGSLERRAELAHDKATLERFLDLWIDTRTAAREAESQGSDADAKVAVALRHAMDEELARAVRRSLREEYLGREASEERLRALYAENPDRFVLPGRRQLTGVLMRKRADGSHAELLGVLLERVKRGEISMEEAAEKFSDDGASRAAKGSLGWHGYDEQGRLNGPLDRVAALQTEIGLVDSIHDLDDSMGFFRIDAVGPPVKQSFEAVRSSLEQEIAQGIPGRVREAASGYCRKHGIEVTANLNEIAGMLPDAALIGQGEKGLWLRSDMEGLFQMPIEQMGAEVLQNRLKAKLESACLTAEARAQGLDRDPGVMASAAFAIDDARYQWIRARLVKEVEQTLNPREEELRGFYADRIDRFQTVNPLTWQREAIPFEKAAPTVLRFYYEDRMGEWHGQWMDGLRKKLGARVDPAERQRVVDELYRIHHREGIDPSKIPHLGLFRQ